MYLPYYDGPYVTPFTHTLPCEIYVMIQFSQGSVCIKSITYGPSYHTHRIGPCEHGKYVHCPEQAEVYQKCTLEVHFQ